MNKVIAVLGAGPGLGTSIARKFGQEGFAVALVARRQAPLDTLAAELAADGIPAAGFTADLRKPDAVAQVLADIANRLGPVHTLYYGPNAPEVFVPAFTLTLAEIEDKMALFLHGLVAAVGAVLPQMRSSGAGTIFAGLGGSAAIGLPFMSGPGPALAAARNYLYSLHGELAPEGIHVGMLTLSAMIRNSGWEAGLKSGQIRMELPPGFQIPEVDPADLAQMIWDAREPGAAPELIYPQRP